MSRSSFSTHAIRQPFLEYAQSLSKNGTTCEGLHQPYLPYAVLANYWTPSRIKEVLRSQSIYTDATKISTRYLRTFSILVAVSGTVHNSLFYITSLVSHLNDDASLPWQATPRGLQGIEGGEALFDAFFESQWKFCPVLLDETNAPYNTSLHRNSVFPFTEIKTVHPDRQAREAVVKIVEVHAEAHEHLPQGIRPPSHMALKIHPQDHMGQYENERVAFETLNKKSPNIVQCLGSFVWISEDRRRTSTLLLEHAKYGTLSDLFKDNNPPYKPEDIKNLWSEIIGITKGLEVIHEQAGLRAVHQDLKPSNILIYPSTNNHNQTSRDFKISDFGASYIVPDEPFGPTRQGIDRRTTRTYSPPELHLNDEIRYNVGFEFDMWAMGCMLMEVAVWISFGERGRQDFRRRRMEETESLPDHQDLGRSDCFHDGSKVLQCVTDVEEWIRKWGRRGDETTLGMVKLVLYHLLVEKNGRCQARDLYHKMKNGMRPPKLSTSSSYPRNSTTTANEKGISESLVESPVSIESSPTDDLSSLPQPSGGHGIPRHALTTGSLRKSTRSGVPGVRRRSQSTTTDHPGVSNERPLTTQPLTDEPLENVLGILPKSSAYPFLTMMKLQEWMEVPRERRRVKRLKLPGWDLVHALLKGRDFEFLIDNSHSMQRYRDEVIHFVRGLAYLVKEVDSDGFQISCTSHPQQKETCKSSSDAVSFVQKSFATGGEALCAMELALDTVLNVIIDKLPDSGSHKKRNGLMPFPRFGSGSKPTTIIIFTDGAWGSSAESVCGVDAPIERCIRKMKRLDIERTHVALQFLRFGSDPVGKHRLHILDDELKKKPENQNYDIVDHKSTEAGIWDILVGPISQDVDGD